MARFHDAASARTGCRAALGRRSPRWAGLLAALGSRSPRWADVLGSLGRRLLRWAAVLGTLLSAACGAPSGNDCDASTRAGVTVRIKNGVNQERICDATVTLQDGDYAETLSPWSSGDNCWYAGAWGRPGRYQLTCSRDGFRPATLRDVVVAEADCGVAGAVREVSLWPE